MIMEKNAIIIRRHMLKSLGLKCPATNSHVYVCMCSEDETESYTEKK